MDRGTAPPAGPRVLVPVTYGLSVRYLLPTGLLAGLAREVTPVVALGFADDALADHLEAAGYEVVVLPSAELTHTYRMFRRRVAVVHQRRLRSPTSRIQRLQRTASGGSPRQRIVTAGRRARDGVGARLAGAARRLEEAEEGQLAQGTNLATFRRLLDDLAVDGVLALTPYHDQDGLLLRAARDTGRPSVTSIISFDNPTTRERMVARSERIVVWNRHNAAEILRAYPDVSPEQVGVIGAPQFDLHHRPELVMTDTEWRDDAGLSADRPVVLYGAGPPALVPGEPDLVREIDRAIDDGRIPGRPFLLVRRHPSDVGDRWDSVRLRHGRVDLPWTPGTTPFRGWPTDDDVRRQMSTLAHSAVHVNVCSSMALDGAVFDRPQVCPTFVPGLSRVASRRIARFYRQEHWAPVAASGGTATVDDVASLVAEVGAGLRDPAARRDGRRRMIAEVLTYDDGRSSERLVAEVARSFGVRDGAFPDTNVR